MHGDHVPVARFLPYQEAYPLAGRLQAEGIPAKVLAQGDNLYPYRGHGGSGAFFQVAVRRPDADRARWILEGIDASRSRDV